MSLMSKGWECPKCGRVNAPWASECPCYKETNKYKESYTTYTSPAIVRSSNSPYICDKDKEFSTTVRSGYCNTSCSNCKEDCGGNKI